MEVLQTVTISAYQPADPDFIQAIQLITKDSLKGIVGNNCWLISQLNKDGIENEHFSYNYTSDTETMQITDTSEFGTYFTVNKNTASSKKLVKETLHMLGETLCGFKVETS